MIEKIMRLRKKLLLLAIGLMLVDAFHKNLHFDFYGYIFWSIALTVAYLLENLLEE